MGKVTVVGGKVGMSFTGLLSISPTTLTLTTDSKKGTITVTRKGDGTISAVSSDTSVATVSVSGTTVIVTGLKTGTAEITISVSKGTLHEKPEPVTCSVIVDFSLKLSTIAEGSIVKVNENGSPVEFYVAKHNYESELNGAGRTLLVRKDGHSSQHWNNASVIAYASSFVDTWLNDTYKAVLEPSVQSAIGTTKFYYTAGNGTASISTLSRGVFLLSMKEVGVMPNGTKCNAEGSTLPISSLLPVLYINGTAVEWWSRSPYLDSTKYLVWGFTTGGAAGSITVNKYTKGVRPCFTLPATAKFNPNTLVFEGVS